MVSSNLTSQPYWLDTFPTESPAYGFDEGGMWFSGNATPSEALAIYPIRTNYDINSEDRCDVIFTFTYTDVDEGCPDHGICFFKADAEPYWAWGNDVSRIAVQYDCGTPEIAGMSGSASNGYNLQIGQTYTARVIYWPANGYIIHELYEGTNIDGTMVDQLSLNERLDSGTPYRIGFDADMDAGLPDKAYFTYLELSVDPPPPTQTRVFRALHFPHRRREVVSAEDPTPTNVQPGEMLYDDENNKLYAGQTDRTAIEVSGGDGGGGNPFDQDLNTTNNVTFVDTQINGNLRFKADFDNSDTFYITKDDTAGNVSVLQIMAGDDGTGDNVNAYYPTGGSVDYVAIMSTNGGTHHLFGTDGKYYNAGGITLANGTQITVGSFDNGTGGQNGISIHCTVGYELNWQGGRLKSTSDGGVTAANILCDSPIEFPGAGTANMQIDATSVTFPDATTQVSAGVTSTTAGITGATRITNCVAISQIDYDALPTKDAATLYIITG
jgi:hypothetical protein